MALRILGIDYGDARTGVAVSDELGLMAHGVETVFEKNPREVARRIEELAQELNVQRIVVGLPKNMNNSIGARAERTLEFVKVLEGRTKLSVVLWDERLTTVSAANALNVVNARGDKRKKIIDTVAAVHLLQAYIDYNRRRQQNE